MSDAILTPEEALDWYAAKPDGSWDSLNDDARMLNSHEALRARLAEVEAERDEAVRRSALDEAQCDHMTDTAGRLAVELAAAEARLAEAVELLRGLIDSPDDIDPRLRYIVLQPDREDVARARVFIEEQGQ